VEAQRRLQKLAETDPIVNLHARYFQEGKYSSEREMLCGLVIALSELLKEAVSKNV
jgi:hypothetical protein